MTRWVGKIEVSDCTCEVLCFRRTGVLKGREFAAAGVSGEWSLVSVTG